MDIFDLDNGKILQEYTMDLYMYIDMGDIWQIGNISKRSEEDK